jgi:hypothetical protein
LNWAQHISFSLLILVMGSCTKPGAPNCVKSLGQIQSETRMLDAFTRIEIQGRLDLNLVQDSSDWAEITFGESLLDGIKTRVNDGVLRITEENSCDWLRKQSTWPLVTVHYSNLQNVYNESAGSVTFINPHSTGQLTFEIYDVSGEVSIQFIGKDLSVIAHTGATNVTVKGSSDLAYFYNASYAPFRCKKLVTKVAQPHSESTGDIELFATEAVYYQIFDWGNITVHGNPPLIKKWHDEGTGELILIHD